MYVVYLIIIKQNISIQNFKFKDWYKCSRFVWGSKKIQIGVQYNLIKLIKL